MQTAPRLQPYGYPQSNWKEANIKNTSPAVGLKLNDSGVPAAVSLPAHHQRQVGEAADKFLAPSSSPSRSSSSPSRTSGAQLRGDQQQLPGRLTMETARKEHPRRLWKT